MSQARLETARRLIQQRKYDAARAILEKIDDDDAFRMLAEIDVLANSRPSLLRPPYGCVLLLGFLIPLALGAVLFRLASGDPLPALLVGQQPTATLAQPTIPPTNTQIPAPTLTLTHTPIPTDTATFTPTLTPTPADSPTPTRELPPTWTPTDHPLVVTPDATGTALAEFVATGQALVAATQTVSARNINLETKGTQVLGVVGTPDATCMTESRGWWRSARLIAADTFFSLADDYNATITLILENPDQYGGMIQNLQVDFLISLREQASTVEYPACAYTARQMLLADMQYRILAFSSFAAGDQPTYESNVEQATTYDQFFERELGILNVQRK